MSGNSVPAVVLTSYHHGGLGIARSLGRCGVKVLCVISEMLSPISFSRYCSESFIINDEKQRFNCLLDIAERIGCQPLLIPTTDEWAIFLAENAPQLGKHFLFPKQDAQLIRSLSNKKELCAIARKYDIPTPKSFFPASKDEVLKHTQDLNFPLFVKKIQRRPSMHSLKNTYLVHDMTELLNLYCFEDNCEPNLMLQEFIPDSPGSSWMFNGYFNAYSDCLFGMTGKKLREAPPHAGATSLGVCQHCGVIQDMSRTLLSKMDYHGPVDIDYKFDARDGKYKILDINPRVGLTFRLFTENGLDVTRAEYYDLTGKSVYQMPSSKNDGRKFVVEDADFFSSIKYSAEGNLDFKKYLWSFVGVKEAAWFSYDDPLPLFIEVARLMKEGVKKILS